jgi:hypothetical protein
LMRMRREAEAPVVVCAVSFLLFGTSLNFDIF